jgi:hypothetical protein
MPPSHVSVTAPEGKLTPIHTEDGCEPGGYILYVKPGWISRVRYSQSIRRSITRLDLTLCNMDGAPVASCELAAAPTDFGKIEIKKGGTP